MSECKVFLATGIMLWADAHEVLPDLWNKFFLPLVMTTASSAKVEMKDVDCAVRK